MAEGGLDDDGWGAGSESCMELRQKQPGVVSKVGFVREVREVRDVRDVSTVAEGGLDDDGWGAGSDTGDI